MEEKQINNSDPVGFLPLVLIGQSFYFLIQHGMSAISMEEKQINNSDPVGFQWIHQMEKETDDSVNR